MRERRWNRAMAQATKKYGTRKMTLRDLRSSATSRWLRKGMSIQDAAQWLGNSPEIIRQNYSDQVEDKVVSIVRGK
jgi:integrase